MNTDEIRENLNYGLNTLSRKTLGELESARSNALLHYKEKPVFALAGHYSFYHRHPRISLWLPLAALVIGVFAVLYWPSQDQPDPSDIDAALLSDDLPVHAFTDQKFFDSWLKRSQQ